MKTVVAAVIGLLVLTACSTEDGSTATDPAGSPSSQAPSDEAPGDAMPTTVPPPAGEVIGLGTVLDIGEPTGPELCLGVVAESYPPQCSGLPLTGWEWEQVGDTFEESGTTRWGSYAVTGTYDGSTVTVTDPPVTAALYDPAAPVDDPFATRCEEPAGGWAVVDPDRVGFEDQDAAISTAVQLPGYAGSFVDQSGLTGEPEAAQTLINVLVTEDVAGAEEALREVWGGALCVSEAQRTEQDLIGIQDGLAGLPGLLSSGAELDGVSVDVVWDDGSLQAWAEATYGEGLVRVDSALREVG